MEQIIFVRWKVRQAETARIVRLLPELAAKTRAEAGNVSYDIYRSTQDENEFVLYERYVDAAAAEAHKQSDHYKRIVLEEIIPYLDVREVVRVQNFL